MRDALPEPALPAGVSPETTRVHLDKLLARLPDGTLVYACLRDLLARSPRTHGNQTCARGGTLDNQGILPSQPVKFREPKHRTVKGETITAMSPARLSVVLRRNPRE